MIPQWKMNGKDMRFDGSIEFGVVEVRYLFDDLVVTLWVEQEGDNITVKSLGGIGNGRYDVQVQSREKPVEEGEEWKSQLKQTGRAETVKMAVEAPSARLLRLILNKKIL